METPTRTDLGTTQSGARNGLSGWHEHQRSSEIGRSSKKGPSFKEPDHREALERSRDGYGTEVCMIDDGQGIRHRTLFVHG